mmetsp:Transcript_93831/g.268672  ORF Transcript_93831/g.268672 Transcript_93831/m.268672 type:complete len:184 (+) Transcript_93831:785-1336(+)
MLGLAPARDHAGILHRVVHDLQSRVASRESQVATRGARVGRREQSGRVVLMYARAWCQLHPATLRRRCVGFHTKEPLARALLPLLGFLSLPLSLPPPIAHDGVAQPTSMEGSIASASRIINLKDGFRSVNSWKLFSTNALVPADVEPVLQHRMVSCAMFFVSWLRHAMVARGLGPASPPLGRS